MKESLITIITERNQVRSAGYTTEEGNYSSSAF